MASSIFKNKRVALIGPAPHILERQQDFSKYDVVCRVNMMVPITREMLKTTGNRCDVWYPANAVLSAYPELCLSNDVKIIRTTNKGLALIPISCRDKFSKAKWQLEELKKELGCTPNRGLRAIIDILNHRPAELYITGFTFYIGDAYFPGYTNDSHLELTTKKMGNIGGHKQDSQMKYFKEKIIPNPVVKLDWKLKELFPL